MYWYKGKHPWNISPFFTFSSCCCKSKWCVTNNPIIYQIILYFLFINQMMYSTNILIALFCGFTSLISFCLDDAKMFQHFSFTFYDYIDEQMFHEILFLIKIKYLKLFNVLYFHYRAIMAWVLFSNIYWKIGSWIYELSMDKYSSFWYTCLTEK